MTNRTRIPAALAAAVLAASLLLGAPAQAEDVPSDPPCSTSGADGRPYCQPACPTTDEAPHTIANLRDRLDRKDARIDRLRARVERLRAR